MPAGCPQLDTMDQQGFGQLNAVSAAQVPAANAHNEVEAVEIPQGREVVTVIAAEGRLASTQ